jgi:hypothetical protein
VDVRLRRHIVRSVKVCVCVGGGGGYLN